MRRLPFAIAFTLGFSCAFARAADNVETVTVSKGAMVRILSEWDGKNFPDVLLARILTAGESSVIQGAQPGDIVTLDNSKGQVTQLFDAFRTLGDLYRDNPQALKTNVIARAKAAIQSLSVNPDGTRAAELAAIEIAEALGNIDSFGTPNDSSNAASCFDTASEPPPFKVYEAKNTGMSYPDFKFDSCKKGNGYQENSNQQVNELLAGLGIPAGSALEPQDKNGLSPVCIYQSMKHALPSNKYGYCSSTTGKPSVKVPCGDRGKATCKTQMPCVSKPAFEATHNSFALATSCLDVSGKELFPLLNHESGFQASAISWSGCAGIGQLSGIGIRDVNELIARDKAKITSKIESKSRPECKAVLDAMSEPMLDLPGNRCAATFGPQQPLKNLVFSALHYKNYEFQIRSGVEKVLGLLPSSYKPTFTPDELDKLILNLSRQSYNGGVGTVKTYVKAALTTPNRYKSIQALEDKINELMKKRADRARKSPKPNQGDLRLPEVADYNEGLRKSARRVQKHLKGAECGFD